MIFLLFLLILVVNELQGEWVTGFGTCKISEASLFTTHGAGVAFLVVTIQFTKYLQHPNITGNLKLPNLFLIWTIIIYLYNECEILLFIRHLFVLHQIL